MQNRFQRMLVATIVAAGVALLTAAGSADAATFGVATGAQVESDQLVPPETSAGVACWYDFGGTLTGWSGGADCPHGGVVNMPPGSTVTYSATPGGAGQTASFAQVAVSWSGTSGTASGAADLAQGTLRASTFLNGVTGLFLISSGATAQFADSLTFSIPGAGPSTVTNIDVYYRVNGIYSTNFGSAQVGAYMNFGQAAMQYVAGYEPCCDNLPPHIMTETSSGWVSADFSGTTTSAVIFHGVYSLQGASPVIPNFVANLDVSCRADNHTPPTATVCDYGDRTGRVHLALPPGVTFTPDSGVFNPFRMSAHDLDGDDASDLLWRDTSGNVAAWVMNGAQVIQSAGIGAAGPW
jgi:hypothetical protein